ncbi:MAG: VWA domain-containing protein [Gammaproteobacteria bacterium]|nr:VWA domain-containing protein [Gammaproteobacteria bacterium]
MTKKLLLLIAMLGLIVGLSGCWQRIDSSEKAAEVINGWVEKDINPSFRENQYKANIRLTQTNLLSLLPDIREYPIVFGPRDNARVEVVEIFTSSEKSGSRRDGFYIELADAFNNERIQLSNGKTAAVAIRKIASGLGTQYMLAGQYMPDAFSPSNLLWGAMLESAGVELTTVAESTAPNTAGIVVKKDQLDQITTAGILDVAKLLTNVTSGSFSMGYTNPYTSSTGLNFLLTILNEFADGDESQMLSPDVASAFEAFQTGVPFVAQTTLQMRDAAQESGVLDGMVMENQSWVNVTGMRDYTFVPFGVRHDSPLYATPEADESEREVLDMFAQFIERNQRAAQQFGFGENRSYQSAYQISDPSILSQAQRLWKQKKSGGRPIAAVFVADVSGSMEGKRIRNLKQALTESSDLISSVNAIGLVTYNEQVNVDLPIREFDVQQKSLFIGAVERLAVGGRTATNDAVLVAADLLADFQKSNPDHKAVIFVLSDGERNRGFSLEDVRAAMEWTSIPVHSIAYEIESDELKQLSSLAEGAYITSTAESASYRIGNLLNSEM